MPYQVIYSSESTIPMQSEDLDELLAQARRNNAAQGISGALVYADGMFLQILEGDEPRVQALLERIARDLRHEKFTVLQEREVPVARFADWKMAYVGATAEQVARWAGIGQATGRPTGDGDAASDARRDLHQTAQFAEDILALLTR